jgi:hypothetical protein
MRFPRFFARLSVYDIFWRVVFCFFVELTMLGNGRAIEANDAHLTLLALLVPHLPRPEYFIHMV